MAEPGDISALFPHDLDVVTPDFQILPPHPQQKFF
jgi:hypothetical protein